MSWANIGAAAITAAGSYMSAKQANKGKSNIVSGAQLNSDQIPVSNQVGSFLSRDYSERIPEYTGDYSATLTPEEQSVLVQQSRLGALTSSWGDKFQPGYIDPEVDRTELANLNRAFYGDGLNPGAKALAEEQFAGTGGYWGDARAKGVMETYANTVTNPYNTWRSNALQNSYKNALDYSTIASETNKTNAALQQIPRLIQQYNLEKKYAEWLRTSPENAPYIDKALSFLGLGTNAATYQPASPSFMGTALSSLGSGLQVAALLQSMNKNNTNNDSSNNSALYNTLNNTQTNNAYLQQGNLTYS